MTEIKGVERGYDANDVTERKRERKSRACELGVALLDWFLFVGRRRVLG